MATNRSAEIWNNVSDISGGENVDFSSRAAFNVKFGYVGKPPEERAVLDSYWNQAKALMASGKSAFQAITSLKASGYNSSGNASSPQYDQATLNSAKKMLDDNGGTLESLRRNQWLAPGQDNYYTLRAQAYLDSVANSGSTMNTSGTVISSTAPDGTISASVATPPQIDYGNWPATPQGWQASPFLDSQVNLGDEAQRQANFESGFQAYIDAQTAVYGIETTRQNRKFGEQRQDAGTAIARNREDYAKFTGREITDTARTLAKNDTSFAKSLSSATQAYGKRGIINAGIQKSSLWEAVSEFGWDQNYLKTLSQRRLSDAGTANSRAETDYTTNMGRLDTTVSEYAGDRAAGLAAQTATLQQQGDTLYNAAQVQNAQLAQQQADQAALDRHYGRTPQNRPITMRMGWKYTT